MCGIFAILNNENTDSLKVPSFANKEQITDEFYKGQMRGPEHSIINFLNEKSFIQGFHRLAINGLNTASNQPLNYEGCSLICNGEIYNYNAL